MNRILAFIISLSTIFSLLLGTVGNSDCTDNTYFKDKFCSVINKHKIISTEYIGEVSTETWSADDEYTLDETAVLIKEKDKDFVILNLSDMHFTDYGAKSIPLKETANKIKTMVTSVRPDLITVSGDIVCNTSTYFAVRRFTDLMESFGIPWAPVFGNHDNEGNCDMNYLADIMMTSPHCLMKKGDPDLGVGNYIINIAEENDDGSLKVVESVIMVFSHNYGNNDKQLQWYKWAVDGVNEVSGGSVEVSMFCHIPLAEYQYAYDAAWDSENNCWHEGFDAYGKRGENIAYGRDSSGVPYQKDFFNVIKQTGSTKYIFCGHDHLNNFSILYEGIRLTYSMKIGRVSGSNFMLNGGTEITLSSDGITNIKQKSLALGPVITLENIITK